MEWWNPSCSSSAWSTFSSSTSRQLARFTRSEMARRLRSSRAIASSTPVVGCGGSSRGSAGRKNSVTLLHREHLVHVRAAELEDAQHPGVRGDDLEPGGHLLEERSLALGVIEAQLKPVQVVGDRREDLDGGVRVLPHVPLGLVEELVGERHVRLVHQVHLADLGDVRLALQRAGGHHRRDDALEAGGDVAQGDHRRLRSRAPQRRLERLAGGRTGRLEEQRLHPEPHRHRRPDLGPEHEGPRALPAARASGRDRARY